MSPDDNEMANAVPSTSVTPAPSPPSVALAFVDHGWDTEVTLQRASLTSAHMLAP